MGRFLNADTFASTGQGILGNNMFAYCLNNPVNGCDSSGNAYQGIYSQINYNEHDHTYGGRRENFYTLPEETSLNKAEKYIKNEDESVVLAANYYAFYKGTLVVRTNKEDKYEIYTTTNVLFMRGFHLSIILPWLLLLP